jgi:hypothetical protein
VWLLLLLDHHHRARAAEALGVPESSLELSMGMSGDFEQAVRLQPAHTHHNCTAHPLLSVSCVRFWLLCIFQLILLMGNA